MVVFDIEIAKAIPSKSEMKNPFFMEPGIDYCEGWEDFENMGIACICTYDFRKGMFNVYLEDNLETFYSEVFGGPTPRTLISFNGINFDSQLLEHHIPDQFRFNLTSAPHLDLLQLIWRAKGLGPKFQYPSHTGYSLDAMAKANLGRGKSSSGAQVPSDWQRGKRGGVIDYCLRDVALTGRLFQLALDRQLKDPRDGGYLTLPIAEEVHKEFWVDVANRLNGQPVLPKIEGNGKLFSH
jgi:hypothetical protein